jgi:hypothetical protein
VIQHDAAIQAVNAPAEAASSDMPTIKYKPNVTIHGKSVEAIAAGPISTSAER